MIITSRRQTASTTRLVRVDVNAGAPTLPDVAAADERRAVEIGRFMALTSETRAAGRLGAEGVRLLGRFRGPTVDADPMFALLASAVEKLLKLTIGLDDEAMHGSWPSRSTMLDYGHNLTKLDVEACAHI